MTMISIFSSFVDSITTDALLWWFSRTTLVLTLACAFLAVASRARPATRHVVAVTSLFAVALLPLAMAALPSLSLPVLPAVATPPTHSVPVSNRTVFAIDASSSDAVHVPVIDNRSLNETLTAARAAMESTGVTPRAPLDWKSAGILAWVAITLGVLFQLAVGMAKARRAARHSIIADRQLVAECERARRVIGLGQRVDVRLTSSVTIPMVVGTFRPRVLLPEIALMWSPERLRVVLLHEFAHVRRHDGLWMLAARVVTAIYWFHPLVWVLSRHVRRDAERACDEIVLASGVRGSDYAEHLVAIARVAATRNVWASTALTLATRSSLEQRVVSILSTRVLRAGWSRRTGRVCPDCHRAPDARRVSANYHDGAVGPGEREMRGCDARCRTGDVARASHRVRDGLSSRTRADV
jgi:beta-lactamase regulating signal transducer with metallopeptidase domain